jgi:hypothetical protein
VTTFQVTRDGERDIVFDGYLSCEHSTQHPSRPRWLEGRVYTTKAGVTVLSEVSKTTNPGEADRSKAVTVPPGTSKEDLAEAMRTFFHAKLARPIINASGLTFPSETLP